LVRLFCHISQSHALEQKREVEEERGCAWMEEEEDDGNKIRAK